MIGCIVAGLVVMALYFSRTYGNRKANICYGFLLLTFTLSLANNLLHQKVSTDFFFLPIWYTFLFGPLFFFYIKFMLYPAYRVRFSDLKHLFLPILQASFYWIVFLQSTERKLEIHEQLYLPWFKTIEGGLYILSFFGYLALSYRYLKYKESTLRISGFPWQRKKIKWQKVYVRVLFLLAGLNTFYILTDFAAYNFLNINLYNIPSFGRLIDLSFSVVLFWLAWKGWQWVRSKKHLAAVAPELPSEIAGFGLQLDLLAITQKRYLDPELSPDLLALATGKTKSEIYQEIKKSGFSDFHLWLGKYRLAEMEKRRTIPLFAKYHAISLALVSGFPSKRQFYRSRENKEDIVRAIK